MLSSLSREFNKSTNQKINVKSEQKSALDYFGIKESESSLK